MIFQNTDIERALFKLKSKLQAEQEILEEVQHILDADVRTEEIITQNLNSKKRIETNDFTFDLLETKHIYHISQIRKICIDYRLRFLDSRYFKG
ncbi:MAG: hypothetical protein AAF765_07810, partial [Bacteroidota bacterium]